VLANFKQAVEDCKAVDEIKGRLDGIAIGVYVVKHKNSVRSHDSRKVSHKAPEDKPDNIEE
jgi:hypothetical protein